MRYFLFSLWIIFIVPCAVAQKHFEVHNIKLPSDVSYYDNQYSSLYIAGQKLYLMSESRLEDKAQAFLTSVELNDLQKAVDDSTYQPSFAKVPIRGLDAIREKISSENQSYEGLEATTIENGSVYFSIETATPSDDCYFIKGQISADEINIDTSKILRLPKPKDAAGNHIYNSGYEALEIMDHKLCAFYEYNYFPDQNYVVQIDTSLDKASVKKIPMNQFPFRITDVTRIPHTQQFIGINFFYNGEGRDEVYRVPQTDSVNYKLMKDGSSFKSYGRLVKMNYKKDRFECTPFMELPSAYWAYNWEGLSFYKNGFFIMNDKYTPARPYKSTLLYLKIKK